ncbi:MAG: acyl-CoA dehydratase activase [Candidatus Zhuqueibacterota bacterium]
MSFEDNRFYLGIDVGSVSIKLCLVSSEINGSVLSDIYHSNPTQFHPPFFHQIPQQGMYSFLLTTYQRIQGEPLKAAVNLLLPLLSLLPEKFEINLSATGAGGKIISRVLNIPYENEFRAIARGVGIFHPEVRTVLEIGGDSSKYIVLDKIDSETTGILDYEVNGECAAGTGSFIDQQASRLLYAVEEVGGIVMRAGKPANIAGRCSVFAKSDMIHAQQKGFQPPEILKGLCQAVVRNFKGAIIKGKEVIPPVAFIGGVAANRGIVAAVKELFQLEEDSLIVPTYYAWLESIGTALLAGGQSDFRSVEILKNSLQQSGNQSKQFDVMEPIRRDKLLLMREKEIPIELKKTSEKLSVYIGIDIGSVTTKLAVIDDSGNLLKGIYTKTQARPIEVVTKGLAEISQELAERIDIKGVGTTGSGRELIGELISADTIKDEITAHKTGAMYVSETITHIAVDTIFDIGGQDSKYISLEDGIVVDFTMNEACAAGTGSFLEEQAEKLGINIQREFADLAFQSTHPIRLGERCTVFMEKEIIPYLQRGAEKKDIVAGLAYSIVTNYLNRVVAGRRIGDVIYFQGGTAYNDAVAAAFATVLNKQVIVPPYNGILGAIGAALLAREKMKRTGKTTLFRGFNLEHITYTLRSFTCKGCTNFCDIQEFNVEGKKTYWGDKCSERYRKEVKLEREPIIPDLLAAKEALLLSDYRAEGSRKQTIGIPRSMYFYDQFPLWYTYFHALGFPVVISDETNRQIVHAGVESRVAEPCFPITVAHGHVTNLLQKNVDFVFVPNVVDAETQFGKTNSFFCPWGQTLCYVLRATPAFIPHRDKILSPTIRYRLGIEEVKKQFSEMAEQLGIRRRDSDLAIEKGYARWREVNSKQLLTGKESVEKILRSGAQAIVLLGRSYNIYDKMVNLNVPAKLHQFYGINIIPLDYLDIDSIDISDINDNMYWNYGRKILQVARWSSQYDSIHLIYITNFKCGPDSYIKHYVREAAKKPYLTIQFDEHGNDAGIMTRCEAYLDSKGFLR